MQSLVLWDPEGQFWEGALVSEMQARELAGRGVALIPVEPEMFARHAVAGYFRRAWGSGWALAPAEHMALSPMVLYVLSGQQTIHWRARLVPTKEIVEKNKVVQPIAGTLRLVSSSGGLGVSATVAVDIAKLSEPDDAGGWTVGGDTSISPQVEGLYNLALYGAARGVKLIWSAVSNTR